MTAQYYVHMVEDEPPRVYGPYPLKNAKQFALIGSRFGGRRVVTWGKNERVVRVYAKGHRVWPVGPQQVRQAKLDAAEIPIQITPRQPKAPQGVRGVSNPEWANAHTSSLIESMAFAAWCDALCCGSPNSRPNAAHMRRRLREFEKRHGGHHSWWVVANAYGVPSLVDLVALVLLVTSGPEPAENPWR